MFCCCCCYVWKRFWTYLKRGAAEAAAENLSEAEQISEMLQLSTKLEKATKTALKCNKKKSLQCNNSLARIESSGTLRTNI